jgi:CBS domain-containing protein
MSQTVGEVMSAGAVVANAGDTVGEARDRMSQLHISALPVLDPDGELAGIVTAADLLADYDATLPLSRVMTPHVHTLPPDAEAAEAVQVMREHHHHHVVVVEEGRVVGMLSAFDLLALVAAPAGSAID